MSEWATMYGHGSSIASVLGSPHLCDVPDCPGPKLVARLEAAERLAAFLRDEVECMCYPDGVCLRCSELAAWEASEPVKEKP